MRHAKLARHWQELLTQAKLWIGCQASLTLPTLSWKNLEDLMCHFNVKPRVVSCVLPLTWSPLVVPFQLLVFPPTSPGGLALLCHLLCLLIMLFNLNLAALTESTRDWLSRLETLSSALHDRFHSPPPRSSSAGSSSFFSPSDRGGPGAGTSDRELGTSGEFPVLSRGPRGGCT